ncbi:MAG: DUF86 domain-containing protein [Coriobacteriia bacterium]|nr:DUF86 domain-containing protein [Coriobacteriia bacterium]
MFGIESDRQGDIYKLRNLIDHHYAKVNPKRLIDVVENDLDDLEMSLKALKRYITEQLDNGADATGSLPCTGAT